MQTRSPLAALAAFMICMIPAALYSQHDLTIYNFGMVPQRIYENPASFTEQKAWLGVPFLSGIRTAVANPFICNRILVRGDDDSLTFHGEKAVQSLEKNPRISIYESVDILSLGVGVASDRYFLNFAIRQRSAGDAYIPPEIGYLAWYGNTCPQLYGKTVNLAPTVNGMVYDEWSAGVSGYALRDKLRWGATFKFLMGRINISTKKSDMEFYTDSATYNLDVRSDFEINTSGIDEIDNYFNQPFSAIVFPGNRGIGISLGAAYQVTGKISVDASVTDLGYIRWRVNTLKFVSHDPGSEVKYTGMTVDDFMDMLNDFDEYGQKVIDSITGLVDIDSVYDVKYNTALPARINIGATYAINDVSNVSLLLNGIAYGGHLSPALGVSYYYNLKQILGIKVSYNLYNHQYTNFGLGLVVNAGQLQFYAVSDNVPGLICWKTTNNSSVQFGINLNFGEPAK